MTSPKDNSFDKESEIQGVKDYLYERSLMTWAYDLQNLSATEVTSRTDELRTQLGRLGTGVWFGFDTERLDLVVPEEGHVLQPENPSKEEFVTEVEKGKMVSKEPGARLFSLAATFVSLAHGATTTFWDAESGKMGVYDRNWTSYYHIHRDQAGFLLYLESRLSTIFLPNDNPRSVDKNPGRFRSIPAEGGKH